MADGLFNPSRLYEVLAEQGLLPEFLNSTPYSGASGAYNYSTNQMIARKPQTISHEMTHAVQYNLLEDAAMNISEKLRNEKKLTEEEQQFIQAFKKFTGSSAGTVGQLDRKEFDRNQAIVEKQLKDMYKSSGDKMFDAYRTSRKEREAFGVGNLSPAGGYVEGADTQPHLDATMTQEFDILLSMYEKLPKSVRQAFAQRRKEAVKKNKGYTQEDPNWQREGFVNLYEDPFKRTIK